MTPLALGLRLVLRGSRATRVRFLLMTLGCALGVACLAAALSIPAILAAHDGRAAGREVQGDPAPGHSSWSARTPSATVRSRASSSPRRRRGRFPGRRGWREYRGRAKSSSPPRWGICSPNAPGSKRPCRAGSWTPSGLPDSPARRSCTRTWGARAPSCRPTRRGRSAVTGIAGRRRTRQRSTTARSRPCGSRSAVSFCCRSSPISRCACGSRQRPGHGGSRPCGCSD